MPISHHHHHHHRHPQHHHDHPHHRHRHRHRHRHHHQISISMVPTADEIKSNVVSHASGTVFSLIFRRPRNARLSRLSGLR